MNKKLKKIIAREGLVFWGVILLGCLILCISFIYPPYPKPIKSRFDISTAKPVEKIGDYYTSLTQTERNSVKELMDFRKDFPEYNDLDNLTLAEKLANKYPEYQWLYENMKSIHDKNKSTFDWKQVSKVKKATRRRGEIRYIGLSLLFFAYVIYLIPIKFTIWAIRTLREK